MKARPDYSTWLTKEEAADAIDVSTKTIQQLARAGELHQARWRRPSGGMPIAVYAPEDVARVAHARNPSKPFIAKTNGNGEQQLAVTVERRPDDEFLRGLAALRAAVDYTAAARGTTTLFLTLKDAGTVSGLSETYLRRAISSGTLPAVKDRGWRVRRTDLESLPAVLWKPSE